MGGGADEIVGKWNIIYYIVEQILYSRKVGGCMNKNLKKAICILLSVMLVMSIEITVLANTKSSKNVQDVKEIVIGKEERDKQFNIAMDKILSKYDDISTRGPQYHYRAEYFDYVYKTVGGYAGNQPAGGLSFPTGGGFYFSDSGGPSVSGSVSVGLPAPYNFVSFSVNLGNSSSSGYFVTVPDKVNKYKLYVEKTMEVRPYLTYRARVGTENWEVVGGGAVPVVYSVSPYAKRV